MKIKALLCFMLLGFLFSSFTVFKNSDTLETITPPRWELLGAKKVNYANQKAVIQLWGRN